MSNVIGIRGEQPSVLGEPREALISLLESLVEKAKSGQLQSFIGTGFVSDGARLSVWFDQHENVYEMLGSLAWLHAEYVHRHTDALP